ncbi:MAG: PTPDL family protein [Verrucomicrobiota bacterium]
MKITYLALTLFLVYGFAGVGLADIFTLKDGKVLEGKIVREQGDSYVIEYQLNRVNKGIKDFKIVPKKEVVKIVTDKPDDQAFAVIAKLLPTPDLLTEDDYQQRCQAVKSFISKFPNSDRLKDAQGILKKLTDESAAIAAGGRKLQGMMILGPDYRANAFDLDARVFEAKIRDAANKAQTLVLLRDFVEFDRDYQSSASFREVLPLVIKSLQAFHTQLTNELATFDERMDKQAAEAEALAQRDGGSSRRALAEQSAELEVRYKKEKKAEQSWVTPHSSHRQSLEDDNSFAESELQRLTQLRSRPAPTPDGGKVFRNTWKILHGDSAAETVEKAISEAEAAGLPERYVKLLQAEVKAPAVKPAGK